MPTPLPLGMRNALGVFDEMEGERYRKESDNWLKRLQNTPMAKLSKDEPLNIRKGRPKYMVNRGYDTPDHKSTASITTAPDMNDPERDMTALGASPALTAQDIAGDPAPANGADGVGGPEDRKAALERAVRKERLRAAVEQAKAQVAPVEPPKDLKSFNAPQDFSKMRSTASPNALTYGVPVTNRAGKTIPVAEEVAPTPTGGQAFMANAFNSATFGQGDKLRGAVSALMGGNYDETVESTRSWLAKTREAEPGWSFAGDAAGFVAPGAVVGGLVGKGLNAGVQAAQRLSPTLGFLAKTGSAAAQGGAAGGAYGYTVGAENAAQNAGEASPEALAPERAESAKGNALAGATFGSVMPAAGVALRPVGNALSGAAARVMEPFKPGAVAAHNTKVAAGAARRSLERAGIVTVDDLAKRAAKYGDKPVVTGELGQDPLNSLVALVRGKGTTGEKAMAILEDRVTGMPGRMLKDIADETGMTPDQVMGTIDDLVKQGRAKAAPLYDRAEEAPFAETANLERIVRDSPTLRGMLPKATNRVQNQAVARIGQADQMPPLKVYDELKQLVDEEIVSRIEKGQGIDDLEGLRKTLVTELDLISGQAATGVELPPANASLYAAAREAGGEAPRVQQGLKDGQRALSGAKLADDVAREVAGIRGEQLTAYQIGVIRNMVKDVENGSLTPKRVRAQSFQKKLNEVFGEPAAQGLLRKFGIEAELSQKGARWNPNVGSVTSQAMMGGPTSAGDAVVRAGTQAATGNFGGAIKSLVVDGISALRRKGYSEAQLDEIGNILLSSPDDAAAKLFPGQTPGPGSVPPTIPPAGRVRDNSPQGQMSDYGRARTAAMDAGDVNAYAQAAMQEFPQVGPADATRLAVKDFVAARRADELLNKMPAGQSAPIKQALQSGDTEAAIDAVNRVWPNLGREEAASFLDGLGKAPLPKGVQFTDKQSTVWQMMDEGASHRDVAKKLGLEYDTLEEIEAANQYIDVMNRSIAKKLHAAGHVPADPNAARLRSILGPNADKVLPKKPPPPKPEAPPQGGVDKPKK